MTRGESFPRTADRPVKVSYFLLAGVLLLVGGLHLATLLLAILFSHLALTRLQMLTHRGRWAPAGLFLILVCAGTYGLITFLHEALQALPEIADKAIPSVIQLAREYHIELPFTDYDTLMGLATDTVKSQVHYLAQFARLARGAAAQLLFVVAGGVVAVSLFLHPGFELGRESGKAPTNLYSACCEELARRFRLFNESFVTVMGAQVIISAINSVLTGIFAVAAGLPNAVVAVGVTFLCGLLPVVGNLISNTLIVGIGFTVSPRMALGALVFLVAVHKLEYFLNSKIVGWRTHNPLWLTLLALILGERLMGIPGMILAPVVLNYIRLEASRAGWQPPFRRPRPFERR